MLYNPRSVEIIGGVAELILAEDETSDPGPVLCRANFERPDQVFFYRAFLGRALLHNCDISGLVFSEVEWGSRANGKCKVFEEDVDLTHNASEGLVLGMDDPNERNYRLIAQTFQQLKRNYDGRGEAEIAGHFHYGEMEMKRMAAAVPRPVPWWSRQLDARTPPSGKPLPWRVRLWRWWHRHLGFVALYGWASDYGENYIKPVCRVLAVVALFGVLVYPLTGFQSSASAAPPHRARIRLALRSRFPRAWATVS